jgi:hypothetical protein
MPVTCILLVSVRMCNIRSAGIDLPTEGRMSIISLVGSSNGVFLENHLIVKPLFAFLHCHLTLIIYTFVTRFIKPFLLHKSKQLQI